MSNIPLSEDLKSLFDDVTSGRQCGNPVRAILVQSENGILRLVTSAPPEGTDKEDFANVLSKLFATEPIRSGYVLYRLDTKSPAGLFEWLNCAYRPENAKVREKMQYSITQSSLFAGLNEQHFLETIYGGSAKDFSFPSSLRNVRRHDYQNPQISTKGKSASDDADTMTSRDPGISDSIKASAPGSFHSVTEKQDAGDSKASTAPSSNVAPSLETSVVIGEARFANEAKDDAIVHDDQKKGQEAFVTSIEVEEDASIPTEEATRPPSPPEAIGNAAPPPPPAVMSDEERKAREQGEKELVMGIAKGEGVDLNAIPPLNEHLNEEKENKEIEAMEGAAVDPAGLSAVAATTGGVADQPLEAKEEEKGNDASIAPSSNGLKSQDDAMKRNLDTPHATSSAISRGMGTGVASLETEREREIAELKKSDDVARTGGYQGAGGHGMGFKWDPTVEPALRGLATTASGTSEWNLVMLSIDMEREEIQLHSPPCFSPPSDLASNFQSDEPVFAFYRHPESDPQAAASKLGLIYCCPATSSIRQRMLYSSNVAILANSVNELQGLTVIKRLETSDSRELTANVLLEAFVGEDSAPENLALETKPFSRPKKPGRR